MPDLASLFDRTAGHARVTVRWATQTARLMVGVPDYDTYEIGRAHV